MFKKLILLCLALSLLVTCSVPALAVDPVEYYTAHSVEELVHWINTAEANKGEEWEEWHPFLHDAREFFEILTFQSGSEEYSLKEILVASNQDNMQYFFENDNHKFLVYVELPGTQSNPKPSLSQRMGQINYDLGLEYEQLQYTAESVYLNGKVILVYHCNGGEYLKKGSDETELIAPTAYFDWQGYTVMIQGIGDLYGSDWDHAYFNLFSFDFRNLDPIDVKKIDITEEFEDEAFRNFVYSAIGKAPGEPIYDRFVAKIQELEVANTDNNPPVKSLAGLEYFTNLETLTISNCQITELDVSMLKNLKSLTVTHCRNLKSLDVSNLARLKTLTCHNNALTELKLSNPLLTELLCMNNQLSELDLTICPALYALRCDGNNLQTLDITRCPKLSRLSCEHNCFKDTSAIIGYDESEWIKRHGIFSFHPQKLESTETIDISWYNEEDDSFVIRTADQLAGLAQLVNSGTDFYGKTILLENSIDLSDYAENWNDGKGWIPIGHEDAPFRGTFNGNSKTIIGLYINNSEMDYAGLFGYIDKGKVNHLGLMNVVIKAKDYVGGIVGALGTSDWHPHRYPSADCGAVKNCFVTGVVEGVNSVGGIVGTTSCTFTYYCYSAAEVIGKSNVGGIVGSAGICGVENCYSTGSVSGDEKVGGIAGNFSKGSLLNSYATGSVTGRDCVGGIVGRNYFDNLLRQCVALNESVSGTTNVGRIVGYNEEGTYIRTNYALDNMAIFEGNNQKETLFNAHDQVDGEDIVKEDALQAAFWLDTMEYKPSIFTIADGAYPILSEVAKIDTDFYQVTFVDWDGSELKSIFVIPGAAAKAPASPMREGHVFTGWDQAFDNVTGDLTVTATYREAEIGIDYYQVSFVDWDGSELKSMLVVPGAAAEAPEPPVREGYVFTGWDQAFDNVTGNLTVTATYREEKVDTDSFRVSFVDWDRSVIKILFVAPGAAAEAPEPPVREGYVFTGWDQAFDNVTGNLTVTATYRWANPFADMTENDWFYDEVQYVYEKGLMNGVASDRFAPEDDVSRAMAITVLYRLAGSPPFTGFLPASDPFFDLEKGWYYDAVIWGVGHDIVEGYGYSSGYNLFGPDDPVTREQLVTMFWRAQGKPTADTEVLFAYSDAVQISPWAKEAFAWAVSTGLIQGKPGNILDPKGVTSRAQLATILMRTNEAN